MRTLAGFLAMIPTMAFAQVADTAAAQPAGAQQLAGILPLVAIAAVMYLLLIRPQQKRMKEHQGMLVALKKGDEVVTSGGIIGKITADNEADNSFTVEIAKDVQVRVVKSTISMLAGQPVVKKPAAVSKKNAAVKNDNVVPSKSQIANDN